MFIATRLAKAGYYGGDVGQILLVQVDIFKSLIDYETFEVQYEKEFIELNKGDN